MISVTSAELNTWIATFIWPFTRLMGMIAIAPVLGNASLPVRIKVCLGLAITICIVPSLSSLPNVEPLSLEGILILVQQYLIGLSIGFVMRLVFSGIELAGELSSLTMGLGFATFYDPITRGRTSAISQFLAMLCVMIFLSLNIHLLMISTLASSFTTMPIGNMSQDLQGLGYLVFWGGTVFLTGVQLSLPIVGSLLIINAALGILNRAAPQLNLFAVGFPLTLSAGFVVVGLTLPYMTTPITHYLQEGVSEMAAVASGKPIPKPSLSKVSTQEINKSKLINEIK